MSTPSFGLEREYWCKTETCMHRASGPDRFCPVCQPVMPRPTPPLRDYLTAADAGVVA